MKLEILVEEFPRALICVVRAAETAQPLAPVHQVQHPVGRRARDLPDDLGTFDAVLAANLLCRLPEPTKFLNKLGSGLVAPGGHVFFVSPFSWMEEYTAKDKWLSPKDLEDHMTGLGFTLKTQAPEALLIRDHARKYQFIVSHGMLFQKAE